jgi:hypothetical protein
MSARVNERAAEKEKETQKIVNQWVNSQKMKPPDEKVFEINGIVLETSTESKSLEGKIGGAKEDSKSRDLFTTPEDKDLNSRREEDLETVKTSLLEIKSYFELSKEVLNEKNMKEKIRQASETSSY